MCKGHIVHSWDIILDMGTQGLETTLPQLLEGTCKSQTISSLSFGPKGGKSTGLDIITNLGENYYIACNKGAIIARRCMKQRYVELGFTKTVSSGRAIVHVLASRVCQKSVKISQVHPETVICIERMRFSQSCRKLMDGLGSAII